TTRPTLTSGALEHLGTTPLERRGVESMPTTTVIFPTIGDVRSRIVPLGLCGDVIVYSVHCDDCGAFIGSSESSVRAARAEAQMKQGANHGPKGDSCLACRKARSKLTA